MSTSVQVIVLFHSYDIQYLCKMFEKQRDEYHTRNSKALVQHKCNSTTYWLHSFKYEGASMWNKLYLSFRRLPSSSKILKWYGKRSV